MLTSLVLLLVTSLVTQLVACQLQCPQAAASFGDDLHLSSFYVWLDDGVGDVEGDVDAGSTSGDGSCKF